MSTAQASVFTHYLVEVEQPSDFDNWRDQARRLVQCGVGPDQIIWSAPGGTGSLLTLESTLPEPSANALLVRASKAFIERAKLAICHSDENRFAVLYRLLWRMQRNTRIMEDRADPDVRRIEDFARSVRRDMHKMRAFVRFRKVPEGDEDEVDHYVAWFEPYHYILRINAGFFVRRFANMRWSILTPIGSLHWDGQVLEEGPPALHSDAPSGDSAEDLWRTYYGSIFNPARLKISAMLKEMPRKYWKNMPEADLIPELIAGAQARESEMVSAGKIDFGERPDSLLAIENAIHGCRRCPIGELENNSVMGEGAHPATLMIVGEQPGNQEDRSGRPFVGPAGQVLDENLQRAGINRADAYVTNAVKHFKYVQQGKRRLHQSPSAREIDMCRWWIEGERSIVKPKVILALGASAARSMLGKTVSISKARGQAYPLDDGTELWMTVHPSYLLRLDGAAREEQERLFATDLAAVAARLQDIEQGK